MSVLNQSGEEQVECPLCMEPLEVDDLNFYPCTCGYQICRFCWHRIRTDENGLCPACRKAYSENPADFTPLSKEQVAQLKAEKRQRDHQRKAKLTESRKHLASVRVVQKNLVFVVGLPVRLADPDVLKKHEYFGKFGKIHKVVINQSTSYAGSQGPSASAYVTYVKSDDALRAIQSVNNITIDGRSIKSSLGTTKYCSHFMKNQQCPKPDCMYLHEMGDPEASFTKEQMHLGKHQEYEKKLHEVLVSKMAQQTQQTAQPTSGGQHLNGTQQNSSGSAGDGSKHKQNESASEAKGQSKESWPTLAADGTSAPTKSDKKASDKPEVKEKGPKAKGKSKNCANAEKENVKKEKNGRNCDSQATPVVNSTTDKPAKSKEDPTAECVENLSKIHLVDDNSSYYSNNGFQKVENESESSHFDSDSTTVDPNSILNDGLLELNTQDDWQAAFKFLNKSEAPVANGSPPPQTMLPSFPPSQAAFGETQNGFIKLEPQYTTLNHLENFPQNGFDVLKQTDTLIDRHTPFLPNGTNGIPYKHMQAEERLLNSINHSVPFVNLNSKRPDDLVNGLDQMSKFFADFNKHQKESVMFNGCNHESRFVQGVGERQNFVSNHLAENQHAMLLLQQQLMDKRFEEQMLYNIKQLQNPQLLQNHRQFGGDHYFGQNGVGFPHLNNFAQSNLFQGQQRTDRSTEDDLGFDPFHETQKGFAELMESEQTVTNGVAQSSVLPPPPGFLQHSTSHMNSFGSKILPFLNMTTSQQTAAGWNSNYNQQQAQHKGAGPCSDWTTLDPAIVSSSRHFPIASLPLRDQYSSLQALTSQQNVNGQMRSTSYDYQNGTTPFSNYSQQLQQHGYSGGGGFGTQAAAATTNGLSWFGGDLQSQISSPPGFRQQSAAQSKTQEC